MSLDSPEPTPHRAGIGLGTNLGDRLEALRQAREALLSIEGLSAPIVCSAIYETDPVDCAPGAPAFYNAVIELDCALHPTLLLDHLQEIEQSMGRPSKRPRNAPRSIDLDILYAGNLVLQNEEIIIPHPRLIQRRFVLQPLAGVAPELILPGQQQSIVQLLENLDDATEVKKVIDLW